MSQKYQEFYDAVKQSDEQYCLPDAMFVGIVTPEECCRHADDTESDEQICEKMVVIDEWQEYYFEVCQKICRQQAIDEWYDVDQDEITVENEAEQASIVLF